VANSNFKGWLIVSSSTGFDRAALLSPKATLTITALRKGNRSLPLLASLNSIALEKGSRFST
jgi:hypothetical protein